MTDKDTPEAQMREHTSVPTQLTTSTIHRAQALLRSLEYCGDYQDSY